MLTPSTILHRAQQFTNFAISSSTFPNPDLPLASPIRYPEIVNLHSSGTNQVNGKYSLFVEARPRRRTPHRYHPSPQNQAPPPDPHHAPSVGQKGRCWRNQSLSRHVFTCRPRSQMGHHQEEHCGPLQEPFNTPLARYQHRQVVPFPLKESTLPQTGRLANMPPPRLATALVCALS